MGNPPFEDVSPIENGGFPLHKVSLPEGNHHIVPFSEIPETSGQAANIFFFWEKNLALERHVFGHLSLIP